MEIKELLKRRFGYTALKPKQEEIIRYVLKKRDCIGILPTGYGKSITFQLPALMTDGITLVITPLIALMEDQVQNLQNKGIPAEYISSLQSGKEQTEVYLRLGKTNIVYVSAERLQNLRFLREIQNHRVALLVCDEAHTVLWSEDFRAALGKIPKFVAALGYRPPILALTATATPVTLEKISRYIGLQNPALVVAGTDKENLFYNVKYSRNKKKDLLAYVNQYGTSKGLIYCLTVKNCEDVYAYLCSFGIRTGIYHGRLPVEVKREMQEKYKNHEINLMVCTNAFGMGIDISDIRYVVDYDMPLCLEDFIQQSGRASRDGKFAEAVILFQPEDIKTAEYFIRNTSNPEKGTGEIRDVKREKYRKLDSMIEFCLTGRCLHQYISRYFNETHTGNCGMCCNCKRKNF